MIDNEKYLKYKEKVLSMMGAIEEWQAGTELRIEGRKIESYHSDKEIAEKLGITREEAKEIMTIAFKEALMKFGVPNGASQRMEARFDSLFKRSH